MKHPTIILNFVPGGCTGLHQPYDIGIQQPFKLSLKCSYHEDVVTNILVQFEDQEEGKPEVLVFNDHIGAL